MVISSIPTSETFTHVLITISLSRMRSTTSARLEEFVDFMTRAIAFLLEFENSRTLCESQLSGPITVSNNRAIADCRVPVANPLTRALSVPTKGQSRARPPGHTGRCRPSRESDGGDRLTVVTGNMDFIAHYSTKQNMPNMHRPDRARDRTRRCAKPRRSTRFLSSPFETERLIIADTTRLRVLMNTAHLEDHAWWRPWRRP